MKAAAYARYSSDNQREVSLDDQINACKKYAQKNNILIDERHIYTDAATSGSLRDRTGLNRLKEDARAGLFDIVIVDDLSRLDRNASRTLTTIQELIYLGVSLRSVAENLDTSNEDSKLSYQVKAIMNESFIDDLRKKTIRGQLGQKQRGYFVAEAAFGYKSEPVGILIADKKGRLRPEGYKMRIVEHEATIVKRIFQMCADGKSTNKIVKTLNEEEIQSSKHEKHGWNTSTIYRILRNEKYIGKWVWGKRQNRLDPITGIIKQRLRPEGPLYEGFYEELRIIPEELWDKVQKRLEEISETGPAKKGKKGFSKTQNSYVKKFPHELLSGAMICSLCGCSIGKVGGKAGGYYGCLKAARRGCSNKILVRKSVAEQIILSEVAKLIGDSASIKYVLSRVEELSAKLICTVPKEIQTKKTEQAQLKKRINNFVSFISEGNSSKNVAESLSFSEQRMEILEAELKILEATKENAFKAPPLEWIADAIRHIKEILEMQTEQSALLLRKLLGQISLKPVYPKTGKPYLVAMSNLQPLALLEDKRPQKGPLSTESDSGLDTGSNSFHWWRWRESKPTPILYHPAIFLYISVICDDSPIFSNWHQYVKVQESSGKFI